MEIYEETLIFIVRQQYINCYGLEEKKYHKRLQN